MQKGKSETPVSPLVAPDERTAVNAWQNDPAAVVAWTCLALFFFLVCFYTHPVSFCGVMDMAGKAECSMLGLS